MAVAPSQIGESTESKMFRQILKQLERLTAVRAAGGFTPPTTTTSTTPAPVVTYYNVAGCERMEYHVIKFNGPDTLTADTIVSNGTPECWNIVDVAEGPEDVGIVIYIWNNIGNCTPCINAHTTTTTTTIFTPTINWNFIPGVNLVFPPNTDLDTPTGYTKYTGPWSEGYDDGWADNPIVLPTSFYINNIGSTNLYVSTNGYFTLGSGNGNNPSTPAELSNPPGAGGNTFDLEIIPGTILSDENYMGLFTKTFTNGIKHNVKLVVFCTRCCGGDTPRSYILNFYRDSNYQYIETRLNYTNPFTNYVGPYDETDSGNVYKTPTITSQVWRGSLIGTNWNYLGMGVVQ